MSEFFRGWRRKAGGLMLCAALTLMAIWFRSHVISDYIQNDKINCDFATGGGCVYWSRRLHYEIGWDNVYWKKPGWYWNARPYQKTDLQPGDDFQYLAKRWLPGAEFSVAKRDVRPWGETLWSDTVLFWRVSLLWVAIPLTLISGRLLIGANHATQNGASPCLASPVNRV